MTIYDLTQAMKRYRAPVIGALVLLVLFVLLMTFTIKDGGIAFRSSLDYEASVQIAVVDRGTDSLTASDASGQDLTGVADLYASLLGSPEAAEWIAEQNGYTAIQLVDADSGSRSTIITATVLAPTPDMARASALSTYDWLNKKLLEPVITSGFPSPTTTLVPLLFDGPAQSQMNVGTAEGLADAPDTLFIQIESEANSPFALSLEQNAGRVVQKSAVLDPLMTVIISLLSGADEVLDTIRLSPPAAPRLVPATPQLGVLLNDGLIARSVNDDETTYTLNSDSIDLEWQEGFVAVVDQSDEDVESVELALLTTTPGVTTSGGRRGPILAVSVLLGGFILVIAAVVVADTWRKDRDAQTHVAVAVRPADVEDRPADVEDRPADVEDRPADVEVRPADANPSRADTGDGARSQKPSWTQ